MSAPASIIGPFEVLESLGDGAFGAVFVARRVGDPLRRPVAIKVLKAAYTSNPKVLQRTRDEARLLGKLHHPNIVRIEALMEVGGRPILVMELVQGVSLKRLLVKSPQGLLPSVAMECIRLTCIALQAAWTTTGEGGRPLHVIHRDIKPSNILLSIHGQLKVVDFGIATGQFQEREAQTESLVMGSRPYMAPERLDGAADTPAVDMYSAGITLTELLTGTPLNLSINQTLHDRALTEAVRELSPKGLNEDAAVELRALIRRMCAYDAAMRPSAREAAGTLERLVARVDPVDQRSLEAYARDTVEPMYQRRRILPPDDVLSELGPPARTTSEDRSPRVWQRFGHRPAGFVGALFGVLIGLVGVAGKKAYYDLAREPADPPGDLVPVKVWLPAEARARVGDHALAVPGPVLAARGPNQLELMFEDGRVLRCPFVAEDGIAVRYVVERGVGGISIDDGPAQNCVATPSQSPDPDAADDTKTDAPLPVAQQPVSDELSSDAPAATPPPVPVATPSAVTPTAPSPAPSTPAPSSVIPAPPAPVPPPSSPVRPVNDTPTPTSPAP